jgi:hypothetical protein
LHFHLPKPLHGWREFAGEVGIIVLGVLVALTAEQFVETLHWRSEARDFRKAINREMSKNLIIYQINQLQQPCTKRRLDELQTYLDRSTDGATVQLTGKIGEPLWLGQYRSVWDNKDAQVVAHIPVDERLEYAALYDDLRGAADIANAQTEVWHKFVPFEVTGPLTLQERRQLHSLISQALNLSSAMDANWPVFLKEGRDLGIKPEYPREWPDFRPYIRRSDLCKPMLKSP